MMQIDARAEATATPSTDGAAIARSLAEPEAFAGVFDTHFADVHAYVARRAGRERADDLAARTFLIAFERRARYRDELGSARPWLLGIATNLLREHHRSERRLLATTVRLAGQPAPPDGGAGAGEPGDGDLAAALLRLDASQRDALLLHVWGDLSYAEISESLSIPIGTVRSRIARARASLRADLRPAPAGHGAARASRGDR